MTDIKECSRCLLSNQIPGVVIDNESGLCNVCREWDNTWGDWQNRKKEYSDKLENIFNSARKKTGHMMSLFLFLGEKTASMPFIYVARYMD